ncbi:hypothetical protein BC831DRAFT_513164 [Entophlyctis helioformis]|nr:hypothetical protein BC831DRAFT_513164 [Entophlyctis helioformis]
MAPQTPSKGGKSSKSGGKSSEAGWETVEPRSRTQTPARKKQPGSQQGSQPGTPSAASSAASSTPASGTATPSRQAGRNQSFYAALQEGPAPDSAASNKARLLPHEPAVDDSAKDLSPAGRPPASASASAPVPATPQPKAARSSLSGPPGTPSAPRPEPPGIEAIDKAGCLDLAALQAFIATLKKQTNADPIMDLTENLEMAITSSLKICVPIMGSKLFQLEFYRPGKSPVLAWRGPMPFLSVPVAQELLKVVLGCSVEQVAAGLVSLCKALVEGQKRAMITGASVVSTMIAHQLMVQIIAMSHSDLFFVGVGGKNAQSPSPAQLLLETYKSTLGNNPAVGHTLLWIFAQQTVAMTNGSRRPHPKGIEFWIKYFLPIFADSVSVESQLNAASVSAPVASSTPVSKPRGLATAAVQPPLVSSNSFIVDASVKPPSAALTVQHLSLAYIEHVVMATQAALGSEPLPRASRPFVAIERLVDLVDMVFRADAALLKRKRGPEFRDRLKQVYDQIKLLAFHVNAPQIMTSPPAQVMETLLALARPHVDDDVCTEGLAIIALLFGVSGIAMPVRAGKPMASAILRSWTNVYPDYTSESRALVEYLLSLYTSRRSLSRGVWGQRGKTIWDLILESETVLAVEAIHATNVRLLADGAASGRAGKRAGKDERLESIRDTDRDVLLLLGILRRESQVSTRPSVFSFGSLVRLGFLALFALFVWHTVVDVACQVGSERASRSCPVDAVWLHETIDEASVALQQSFDSARRHPVAETIESAVVLPALAGINDAVEWARPQVEEFVSDKLTPEMRDSLATAAGVNVAWNARRGRSLYKTVVSTMGTHVLTARTSLDVDRRLRQAYTQVTESPAVLGAKQALLDIDLVRQALESALWRDTVQSVQAVADFVAEASWVFVLLVQHGLHTVWRVLEDDLHPDEWLQAADVGRSAFADLSHTARGLFDGLFANR